MSDPSSKVSKEENLARIRENQRRSRARRKEYIQELEAKIRSYEQKKLEASVEIQNAARKVIEENGRLRTMLHSRGVTEQEIAHALAEVPITQAPLSTAQANGPNIGSTGTGRHSPFQSAPQMQPSIPQAVGGRKTPIFDGNAQVTTPTSTQSCCPKPTAARDSPVNGIEPALPAQIPQQTEIQPAQIYNTYDYREQKSHQEESWISTTSRPQNHDSNSTSCVNAARIIRTMQSDVGPELEMDLGCKALGQDCRVANPVVFEAIEKYSNRNIKI